MSTAGVRLFSAEALAVLDHMTYDPQARASYELMSGALVWGDEFPRPGSGEWDALSPHWVYRYLLAYRTSLTLGEERPAFRHVWEQVLRSAPNWPGLREERRGPKARRRLLAAQRRTRRCLDDLDAMERDLAGGNP